MKLTYKDAVKSLLYALEGDDVYGQLQSLRKLKALSTVIPPFSRLEQNPTRDGFEYKNVLHHSIKVTSNTCNVTTDIRVRMAALLHDIGKAFTRRFIPDVGWTFHAHDVIGARYVPAILENMKVFSPSEIDYITRLVKLHMRPMKLVGPEVTDAAIRRLITEAGDCLFDLMLLCRCDLTTDVDEKRKSILQNYDHLIQRICDVKRKDLLDSIELPINGNDIMEMAGMGEGDYISDVKTRLRLMIKNGELENTLESCKAAAEKYIKEEILQRGC